MKNFYFAVLIIALLLIFSSCVSNDFYAGDNSVSDIYSTEPELDYDFGSDSGDN